LERLPENRMSQYKNASKRWNSLSPYNYNKPAACSVVLKVTIISVYDCCFENVVISSVT
jgi:hypothetical protein